MTADHNAATRLSEREWAAKLADRVLDRPFGDPDDDLAVLARQLQRAWEREDRARQEGHREGLEEAAKVADDYLCWLEKPESPEVNEWFDAGVVDATSGIAAAIRALATKEGHNG